MLPHSWAVACILCWVLSTYASPFPSIPDKQVPLAGGCPQEFPGCFKTPGCKCPTAYPAGDSEAGVEAGSVDAEKIIPPDNRQPAVHNGYPIFPSVGKLYVDLGASEKVCTGFLIDESVILTAAHCVIGTSFYILFGQTDESDYLEEAEGETRNCRIPDKFRNENSDAYDWAYCRINRANKDDGVRPMTKAASVPSEVDITLVGYPAAPVAAYPNHPVGYTPYEDSCHASFKDNVWIYKCSTTESMSGSPLISDSDDAVVGNHAGEDVDGDFNYGVASVVRPS